MDDEPPELKEILFEEGEGSRAEILEAAFDALLEHGYSELTIDAIGDEFDKSQSLIYHHYESKDELLIDLLGLLTDYFEEQTPGDYRPEKPRERIENFVDATVGVKDRDRTVIGAILELRARAVHDEDYREHFARSDEVIRNALAEDIREGIDEGEFRDVDAEQMAAWLHTTSVGTTFQWVTSDESWVEMHEREVREHLERHLYR